ncbi:MAG: enoyl-CoA hydratase/isomerase family protein [Micrococcales bacterium]|nr:enoyl-CoA hydratase/isomerase family protein [Micrococcales bacterium]
MQLPTLVLERRGPVLTVRISNPPDDLLDGRVIADLDVLGRRLLADRSIRAVVLTGPRPGVFIPHYDIAEIADGAESLGLATPYAGARVSLAALKALRHVPGAYGLLRHTPLAPALDLPTTHAALARFSRLPQVVIAAIDGDAMGGGCEVALACDIRLMSDGDHRIGLPEISTGIPPGAGGTQRLAQVVGPGRAVAMVLQARVLTPQQALDHGLVDQVCDDVQEAAMEVAQRVAAWNPMAVRSAKRAMLPPRGLDVEAAGFMATASHKEAISRMREFGAQPQSPWRDRSWVHQRTEV